MKKNIVILIAAIFAAFFSSCALKDNSQYTPSILTSYFFLNPHDSTPDDTLHLHLNNDRYIADTITVNDTVIFAVGINSYTNNLTAFSIDFDTTALWLSIVNADSLTRGLDMSKTDIAKCKLVFLPGFNYASFPIHYGAKKTGIFDIEMKVESDSEFSPATLLFTQPVE